MNPSLLKQKMKATIYNGLKAKFSSSTSKASGYTAIADEQWEKIADVISDIAADIVTEIMTNAEVLPGIAVVGVGGGVPGPVSGSTVSPGKIL
jgi:tRNA A37 threonylcarbamoyltransferase TsaD